MILLGIFVGFLVGALTLGWTGGLAGAFVGFIAMLAWRSRAQAKAEAQARAAGVSPAPIVPSWPAAGASDVRHRRVDAGRPASPGGDRAAARGHRARDGARAGGDRARRRGSGDRAGAPAVAAVPRRRPRKRRPRPPPYRAREAPLAGSPPAADALPEGFARASDGTLAPVAAAGIAATSPSSPVPELLPPRAVSAGAPNPLWAWFTGGNALTRIGVIALFFGVAFLLKYLAEIVTVPIELKLVGVALAGGALVALGARLARARPGYGLSLRGRGRRDPVPDDVRRVSPVRRAAGVPGVRAARGGRRADRVARRARGRPAAGGPRDRRRVPGAVPRVDGQRVARAALRLLPRAEHRDLRAGLDARVARAQRAGLRVHVRAGHLLGRPLLPARALRDGRAVPRRVLPLLRDDRGPLRETRVVRGEGAGRRAARVRRAARRVRAAGGARRRHALRRRVERRRVGGVLRRARRRALPARGAGPRAARARVPRARHHLRDDRGAVRRRPALDVGVVGARGRRRLLDRLPAAPAARARVRAAAAGRRGRRVRRRRRRARAAPVPQCDVPRHHADRAGRAGHGLRRGPAARRGLGARARARPGAAAVGRGVVVLRRRARDRARAAGPRRGQRVPRLRDGQRRAGAAAAPTALPGRGSRGSARRCCRRWPSSRWSTGTRCARRSRLRLARLAARVGRRTGACCTRPMRCAPTARAADAASGRAARFLAFAHAASAHRARRVAVVGGERVGRPRVPGGHGVDAERGRVAGDRVPAADGARRETCRAGR